MVAKKRSNFLCFVIMIYASVNAVFKRVFANCTFMLLILLHFFKLFKRYAVLFN